MEMALRASDRSQRCVQTSEEERSHCDSLYTVRKEGFLEGSSDASGYSVSKGVPLSGRSFRCRFNGFSPKLPFTEGRRI